MLQEEGFQALYKAIKRRLFEPAVHPVHFALQEITTSDDFVIVQLGGYVGNTENDPLFKSLEKKFQQNCGCLIVVEPVKEYFDKLAENYGNNSCVKCENVAISDRSGPATFYRIGVNPVEYGYPEWLSQLGSLKKERMELLWDKHEANQEYKQFYLRHRIEQSVNCITFAELLRRHRVSKIDLLQMDVEGFELEILRTVNFDQIPVRFVNYESALLHDRKDEAKALMNGHGYRTVDYSGDTFCYKHPDRALASRWSFAARDRGSIDNAIANMER